MKKNLKVHDKEISETGRREINRLLRAILADLRKIIKMQVKSFRRWKQPSTHIFYDEKKKTIAGLKRVMGKS